MENMTYHAKIERAERIQKIVELIGMGQIIKKQFRQAEIGSRGNWICITDTGITIVKDADGIKIVTIYVTTQRELVAVFGGPKKVPSFLKKKVDRNQSLYTKEGKTIWR